MAFERVLPVLRRLPVTIALTGLVSVVFAVELWTGGITMVHLQRMGALNPERIVVYGESWRLITPMFLHGGWLHFGVNTFALVQLAALTEILFGSHRLLGFTLVCGLAASLTSALMSPVWMVGGVGASGFLFGLVGLIMGVAMYGAPHWRVQLARPLRALVFTVGLALAMAVAELMLGTRMVDHWAHLGGFVCGLLLAAAYPEPAAPTQGWERLLAWGAAGVFAGSLGAASLQGEAVLDTLPDQWTRASEAHLEASPGPFGEAMALVRGLEGMRELELDDREARARALIDKLSPDGMAYAVSLFYAQEGRDDEVVWLSERWAELVPEESNPHNVLAWVLVTHADEAQRDADRALAEVDRALALLDDDAQVADEDRAGARAAYLDTRAEALFQLGRYQEALTDQQEAVEIGEAEEVASLDEMKERLARIERALGS